MTTNLDLQNRKALEIILSEHMSHFTARDLYLKYCDIMHDTSSNWHDFSDYLDYLNTSKIVKIDGFTRDRLTIYSLS